MFTSHIQLKRKTPTQKADRAEYIKQLVDEYYTTTDVEAQEQVTANLANFAYDPINWSYLKDAEALELFTELILLPNDKLVLHGLAGLSNLCLDSQAFEHIKQPKHCAIIINILLTAKNSDSLINVLGLIYQLLSTDVTLKGNLLTPAVLRHLSELRQHFNDKRIHNLIQILQADFATRNELIEVS